MRIFGWIAFYGWALASLASGIGMALRHGLNDFKANWENAFYLWQGYDIYDPAVIQQFDLYPHFPPSCFALLFPLTAVPETWAKIIWLVLNLAFTVFLVRELLDLFWERKYFWPILALFVACGPYQTHTHAGQYTLFSLTFFVLALKWDKQGKIFLSGVALIFAFFKFTLIIPMLLYFWLYRRSWKGTALAAGFHLFIHGVLCLYLKKSPFYLLWGPFEFSTKTADRTTDGYVDFFAFSFRLTGQTNWVPWILAGLTLVVLIYLLVRKPQGDGLGLLALTAMTASVLMYHRSYDYVIILLPILWFCKEWRGKGIGWIFLPGIFFVGYVSFHYFYLIPEGRGQGIIDFMNGDTYMNLLSLLWYLSLGVLAFYLFSSGRNQPHPFRKV